MWGYGNYMGSWWMAGGVVILLIVVVGLVVWIALSSRRAGPAGSAMATPPRQILDERYAKGELTTEEYRERIQALTTKS